jgi:hypothetical protein
MRCRRCSGSPGRFHRFAVEIAVGGDLELVNRDTPLGGYLEDVVEEAAGDGDVD